MKKMLIECKVKDANRAIVSAAKYFIGYNILSKCAQLLEYFHEPEHLQLMLSELAKTDGIRDSSY